MIEFYYYLAMFVCGMVTGTAVSLFAVWLQMKDIDL